MILLHLTLFFHVIFFTRALKFPSPLLYNLKFFPKGFDKLPPKSPPGVGNEELYTPLYLTTLACVWVQGSFHLPLLSLELRRDALNADIEPGIVALTFTDFRSVNAEI